MRTNEAKGRQWLSPWQFATPISAIHILESEGEAALTMRRIARDIGVSQAAPYSHFKNKRDLLTAVCIEAQYGLATP